MIRKIFNRVGFAAMALAVVLWAGSGCEDQNVANTGNSSSGNAFLGTWVIYDQTAGDAAEPFYVHFQSDNTFFFSDSPDATAAGDAYTVENGQLTGNFVNPGVGDGRIECTIEGDELVMSFIEYWHDPANVVPYRGTRL
jgi:hypothetical protein